MKPLFSLPVILNQPDYKAAQRVAYCPQDVELFRPPRLVDASVAYCPQDVELFRPPRLVDANVAYCPQDVEAFYPLWTPADISTDMWLDPSDVATIQSQSIVAIDPTINFVSQISDKSGNNNNFINDFDFYETDGITLKAGPYPVPKKEIYNGLNTIRFFNKTDTNQNNNYIENSFLECLNTNFFVNCDALSFFAVIVDYRQGGLNNITPRYFDVYDNTINTTHFNLDFHVNHNSETLTSFAKLYIRSFDYINGINIRTDDLAADQYEPLPILFGAQATDFLDSGILINFPHPNIFIGGKPDVSVAANGNLCELIIIKDIITQEIKEKIEGYLAHKWGMTSQLASEHPYKNKPPRNLFEI